MDFEHVPFATTTYQDWAGTAAAENSTDTWTALCELAGLNKDSWWILAVDAFAFNHQQEPEWTIRIYAFDRAGYAVKGSDEMVRLEAERGSVPVVEILLHDVSLNDVVKCMKAVHLQVRWRDCPAIDVVDLGDHPPQDDDGLLDDG
jgi:hypothetical protein